METRDAGVPIRWWHIALLLGGALLVRLVFLVGMTGSDDLSYASQALTISHGWPVSSGYIANLRLGIIVPTAFAYQFFGVSTASTIWFVMCCSLLGVLAATLLGRELFGPRAGLWAGVLYAVLPIDVVEAGMLLPDVCVAALTALALVCVLRGERATSPSAKATFFAGAGLLVGAGYLCKESALMAVLVLIAYLIIRRKAVWLAPMLAGLAAVIVAEGVFYQATLGSFFHRFVVFGAWNHAAADGRIAGQLASLWEYPRIMFLSVDSFGLFWYLLVAAVVWAVTTRLKRAWVVLLWVVPLWLLLEFGIASLSQLTFPAHVPRYLTLVTIPGAALIGAMFARLGERRRWLSLSLLSTMTLASSLFFAGLLSAVTESIVWNSRQAAHLLAQLPNSSTYVVTGRPTLEFFAAPGRIEMQSLFRKHDPDTGADTEPRPLSELDFSYVVVDHRLIAFRQERQALKLPQYLVEIPSNWKKVAVIRNDFSGIRYIPVRLVDWVLGKNLLPGPVQARFARTLGAVMRNNECVIYEVLAVPALPRTNVITPGDTE